MVKACIYEKYSAAYLAAFEGLVNEILHCF